MAIRNHYLRKSLRFLYRLVLATAAVSIFFIATQDFQIFPGLYSSIILGHSSQPPTDVEALATISNDGTTVNMWRVSVPPQERRAVAILFHGNAEHLSSFVHVQKWLKSLGIITYSVEYRGYSGRNSGWPSERGFYEDAEAAYKFVASEEKVEPKDVVIFGSSIGTGTAAYLAQKIEAGTLVLISPYSSLTELISEMPVFGYLVPFVKYHFPTADYVAKLRETCVVVAHGRRDTTIAFEHSVRIKTAYRGRGEFTLVESEDAGHNDALGRTFERVGQEIVGCVAR